MPWYQFFKWFPSTSVLYIKNILKKSINVTHIEQNSQSHNIFTTDGHGTVKSKTSTITKTNYHRNHETNRNYHVDVPRRMAHSPTLRLSIRRAPEWSSETVRASSPSPSLTRSAENVRVISRRNGRRTQGQFVSSSVT